MYDLDTTVCICPSISLSLAENHASDPGCTISNYAISHQPLESSRQQTLSQTKCSGCLKATPTLTHQIGLHLTPCFGWNLFRHLRRPELFVWRLRALQTSPLRCLTYFYICCTEAGTMRNMKRLIRTIGLKMTNVPVD